MCRMMGYVGSPVLLEELLYLPDSSLLRQTVGARMLEMLNLAGMGLAAWDRGLPDPDAPLLYHTPELPLFDRNLRSLSRKIRASALLAHVRGVPLTDQVRVHEANQHPFHYPGARLALAHNGDLAGFRDLRFDLLPHILPSVARCIEGTTDSEWIYALLLSRLGDPAARHSPARIVRAISESFDILRRVREQAGIRQSSSANLVLCDGENLIATRFCFDFGVFSHDDPADGPPHQGAIRYLSQWYTTGSRYGLHPCTLGGGHEWKMIGGSRRADSVLVASEPLTRDVSTWVEVPEYSALSVRRDGEHRRVDLIAI